MVHFIFSTFSSLERYSSLGQTSSSTVALTFLVTSTAAAPHVPKAFPATFRVGTALPAVTSSTTTCPTSGLAASSAYSPSTCTASSTWTTCSAAASLRASARLALSRTQEGLE